MEYSKRPSEIDREEKEKAQLVERKRINPNGNFDTSMKLMKHIQEKNRLAKIRNRNNKNLWYTPESLGITAQDSAQCSIKASNQVDQTSFYSYADVRPVTVN